MTQHLMCILCGHEIKAGDLYHSGKDGRVTWKGFPANAHVDCLRKHEDEHEMFLLTETPSISQSMVG